MTEFPTYNLTHLDIRQLNKDLATIDGTKILEDLLSNLDCTKEYSCGRPMMTHYPMYARHIAAFLYVIDRIEFKQQYQNKRDYYLDLLEKRHINNLKFEKDNPYTEPTKSKTKQKVKTRTYKSKDLFTGEDVILDSKGKRVKEPVKPKKKIIIFKDMFKINFNNDAD